jgi:hypothetical protein
MLFRLRKLLHVFILLCFSITAANAQFASGGTGKYQKQIFWLPWYISSDTSSGLISVVTDTGTYNKNRPFTHDTIPSGVYTWKINNNIRIVGTLNILEGKPILGTINSYDRSGLQRMYTGFNNKKMCIHTIHATTVIFDLKLDFQIKNNNGIWNTVDPKNHGVVFADSESIDGTVSNNRKEEISALVDNTSNWFLIDIPSTTWKNSTTWKSDYTFYSSDTTFSSKTYKKIRIINNNTDDSNNQSNQDGAAFVMYGKGVNEFKRVKLVGRGYTNVMLGYFINSDPSNNDNYEPGYHFQENVITDDGGNFVAMPSTLKFKDAGTKISIPGAKLATDVYIGTRPNVNDPLGDSLSNLGGMRQAVNYYTNINTNTLSYVVNVTNEYNQKAYLYAFLDINKDNKFSASEAVVIEIPANSTNVDYKIVWPTSISNLTGDLNVRLRVTTDELIDNLSTNNIDERSIGMARNGEIVDGVLRILPESEYDPSALPVELIKFNAYAVGLESNKINWITANESNIDYYDLQYSIDGKNFESIAKINANNDIKNTYSYTHKVLNSSSYYRLKIVENGGFKFSNIVYVSNKIENILSIYPNPATNSINVNVLEGNTIAYIYNQMGLLMHEYPLQKGWNTLDISTLANGSYVVKIGVDTYRFVKH